MLFALTHESESEQRQACPGARHHSSFDALLQDVRQEHKILSISLKMRRYDEEAFDGNFDQAKSRD